MFVDYRLVAIVTILFTILLLDMCTTKSRDQHFKKYKGSATILADFNFSTTTAVDDSFQFIDCSDVNYEALARDIRAGVLEISYKKIIISIGNQAAMDNFTNVVYPVNAIINALIDRYGCLSVQIWVVSVLP